MMEFPTPPDGYEIVDREDESGTEVDSRTWLICYPERPSCTGWRRPGTGAGLWSVSEFPHDAVLARPIRKTTCDGSTSTCGPECWTPSVVDVGPSNRAADSETALRARIAELEAERDELSRQLKHEKKCRKYWTDHAARWHRQNSNMARERDDLREELANARKSNNPAELTFGELVRMAVRDQSFDPEA